MDVDAFYRGELLIDDNAVRAACTGGPVESAADIYVFSPGAVWPAGWELEHRTVELSEPVAHPRDPSRMLSVLPVAPGVRVDLVDALVGADAQLAGIVSLRAPEAVVAGTRELIRTLVGGLFGIVAPPERMPHEDHAYDPATIVGAFGAALAAVSHPDITARLGGYDEAMEMLAIELEIRRDGAPWSFDAAYLRAPAAAFETPMTGEEARYAALYVEDLAVHVAAYRARFGDAPPVHRGIAENFPPTFSALELLAKRAEEGAPEPSDLEPITIKRLTPIAVPKLPKKQALFLANFTVFAAFAAGDAVILLGDSAADRPHADAFLGVIRGGNLIPILISDPAGGVARALDGDPYRLRLVTAALRDAVRAGHHEAAVLSPLAMPVDQWLAFGLPDIGDRLVDPDQWYVVEADDPIEDLYDGADADALRAAYHAWFESL